MRFQTRFGRGLRSSSASIPPVRKRSYQRLKVDRGMPSFCSVRRADRRDCSTSRMIASFSMRDISFVVAPIRDHAFFKQPQLQRLFGDDLLEIARLLAQHFHLVAGGRPRRIAGKPLLAGFQELLRPVGIKALSDAFAAAQRGDRLLTAYAFQYDADLLFG